MTLRVPVVSVCLVFRSPLMLTGWQTDLSERTDDIQVKNIVSCRVSSGAETRHRPVRGPQRWTQPHLPAGGALWRDAGERWCFLNVPYLFSVFAT